MPLTFPGRRYRFRATTAAAAASETEVLPKGEPGFVSDTGEVRIGDGVTAFSGLKSSRNHRKIRTVTATGNVNIDDEVLIVNNAGATTQTLPAAAAANASRIITVVGRGGGVVTVSGPAANGALTANAGASFISDGTAWYRITG